MNTTLANIRRIHKTSPNIAIATALAHFVGPHPFDDMAGLKALIREIVPEPYSTPLVGFFREAHDYVGQKRKLTGLPYWFHTEEVAASTVSAYIAARGAGALPQNFNATDVVSAALAHDYYEDVIPVAEDPRFTETPKYLSKAAMDIALELTNEFTKERYPDLHRAERKERELARLLKMSPEAKLIKVADIISNTGDLSAHKPSFAKVYLFEKLDFLVGINHTGLWFQPFIDEAMNQINQGIASMGERS